MNIKIFLPVLFLALIGCGTASTPEDTTPTTTQEPAATATETNTSQAQVKIEDRSGNVLATISWKGDRYEIGYAGKTYYRRTKGDKFKWMDSATNLEMRSINVKPDGFKLKSTDGTMHWKIKLYDDKIKISDNEENLNPWEIRASEGNAVEVNRGTTPVGASEPDAEAGGFIVSSLEQSFHIATEKSSQAYAVLMIKEIPPVEQYMIIAQLIDRGR